MAGGQEVIYLRLVGLAVVFLAGVYVGHLQGSAQVARLERDQAQTTATAVLAERASQAAETDRLTKAVADYETASLTPVDPGVAHRVYLYALSQCPLSSPASAPAGTQRAPAEPPGFERALQGYVDACARDALRLNAIQAAWPK